MKSMIRLLVITVLMAVAIFPAMAQQNTLSGTTFINYIIYNKHRCTRGYFFRSKL